MYEGTLDGSRICIKRVRMYTQDGPQKAARVCCRRRFPCSPTLTKLTALLRRGRNVETSDAPKHRTTIGCHYYTLPAHFGLDAWWRPAGTH